LGTPPKIGGENFSSHEKNELQKRCATVVPNP
jgi:hypothetical protein